MSELTEEQIKTLGQAYQLLSELHSNPETRGDFLKLFKKARPKAYVPELDVAEPHIKRVAELEKKLDDALNGMKTGKEEEKLRQAFDNLKKARGYTDETIAKVQKIMLDKIIPDPEVAADHFDKLNPAPKPAAPSPYVTSRFFDDETSNSLKDWMKDPEAASDREIVKFFDEKAA